MASSSEGDREFGYALTVLPVTHIPGIDDVERQCERRRTTLPNGSSTMKHARHILLVGLLVIEPVAALAQTRYTASLLLDSDPIAWYQESTWNARCALLLGNVGAYAGVETQWLVYPDGPFEVTYTRDALCLGLQWRKPIRFNGKAAYRPTAIPCMDAALRPDTGPRKNRPLAQVSHVWALAYRAESFTYDLDPRVDTIQGLGAHTFNVQNNGLCLDAALALRVWRLNVDAGLMAFLSFPKYAGDLDVFQDRLYTATLPFAYRFELKPTVRVGLNLPLFKLKTLRR